MPLLSFSRLELESADLAFKTMTQRNFQNWVEKVHSGCWFILNCFCQICRHYLFLHMFYIKVHFTDYLKPLWASNDIISFFQTRCQIKGYFNKWCLLDKHNECGFIFIHLYIYSIRSSCFLSRDALLIQRQQHYWYKQLPSFNWVWHSSNWVFMFQLLTAVVFIAKADLIF